MADNYKGPLNYDRDEIVRLVSDYYEFLTKRHIPPEALSYPPEPEGWPEVDEENFAWMNKTKAVFDLTRHLPRIYREGWDRGYEIYPETAAVDYVNGNMGDREQRARERGVAIDDFNINPSLDFAEVPEFMLSLASGTSGRNGAFFLVNTTNGSITLFDMYGSWHGEGRLKPSVRSRDSGLGFLSLLAIN